MADKVEAFINCWRQLNLQDKQKVFVAVQKRDEKGAIFLEEISPSAESLLASGTPTAEVINATNTVYGKIKVLSYYSYLYYYPTMYWSLDKTPDTDDYWVGIYLEGDENTDYLAYQWVYKAAQGSYYIGQLKTVGGAEGAIREENYELRIFKGAYQRLDAVSNVLRGHVNYAPTEIGDIDLDTFQNFLTVDTELKEFINALESEANNEAFKGINSSPCKFKELWNDFNPSEKQLILPILENECLPDEIRCSALTYDNRPEPKLLFPDLGKVEPLLEAMDRVSEPTEIVLSITLNKSSTIVYPVLNTMQTLPSKDSYAGVFLPSSNGLYSSTGYIDWKWVGPGYQGERKLNKIKQTEDGPINAHYIGVIFDLVGSAYTQIGYCGTSIQATISVSPKTPPPTFEPEFDVPVALRNAHLSYLAYQPYYEVEGEIKKYQMKAIKHFYDESTDTHGFVAEGDTDVVVAFRGTASVKNVMSDMWFIKKSVLNGDYCHGGFVDALNSVYDSVYNCISPFLSSGRKITFTGHSLGAALASMMMYRVIKVTHSSHYLALYAYGCPPVGDISFSNFFKGRVSNIITIFGDPVSTGQLVMLGPWVGLYKPVEVYYLHQSAGHAIKDYIHQLEQLNIGKKRLISI